MHVLSLEFSTTCTPGLGDTAVSLVVVQYSARGAKYMSRARETPVVVKVVSKKTGHHIETYARITALSEGTPKHENSYLT